MKLGKCLQNEMFIFNDRQVKLLRVFHILVDMRVKKQGIHAPRERLQPLVQMLESGCGREFTTVLVLNVFDVGTVFSFHIVDPGKANSNGRKANIEADFPPQVGGLSCMVNEGFIGL